MKQSSSVLITLMLVGLMIMWGGSFVAIKIGLRYLSPFELLLARFLPSALMLLPVGMIAQRRRVESGGLWKSLGSRERLLLVMMGFVAVPAYHFCLNTGETMIPSGWAGLVISLNPAAILIFAAWLLKEPVGVRRVVGVMLAFGGLVFIAITHNALNDAGESVPLSRKLLGMGITLGAVISWGVFTVGSKRLIRERNPLEVISWVVVIGAIWLLPGLRLEFFRRMIAAPAELWWAILFLSVGCTVIGFIVWYYAIDKWQAGRAGAFIYLVPLFALIVGNVMLGEALDGLTAIGAAGVLAGVFLAGKRATSIQPTAGD